MGTVSYLADIVSTPDANFGTWSAGGWATAVVAALLFGIAVVVLGTLAWKGMRELIDTRPVQERRTVTTATWRGVAEYTASTAVCLGVYAGFAWWTSAGNGLFQRLEQAALIAVPLLGGVGCGLRGATQPLGTGDEAAAKMWGVTVSFLALLGIGALIVFR